jgi:simple sugar transport system substrate-binding protein
MKCSLIAVMGFAALIGSYAYAASSGPLDTSAVRKDLTVKEAGKKFKIATIVKIDGIAWFERMREGDKQFESDTGQDAWMVGPAHYDAAEQVQLVENTIAQGVDAICIVPVSTEALEPVLKKARDRGIVVIAHESSGLKNVDYKIEAFDNEAYGENMMKTLAKAMGEKGEYVTSVSTLTSESHMQWVNAAVAYQNAHYPNMKDVGPPMEITDTSGYDKLKEAIVAHPDLRGAIGASMPSATGAGQLVAERGLQGKFFFVGTSLVSVAGKYIADGDVSAIQFWDPAAAGYAMDELAVLALEGKRGEIKAGLNLGIAGYTDLKAPTEPNLLYGAGWVNVTKDNMNKYNF